MKKHIIDATKEEKNMYMRTADFIMILPICLELFQAFLDGSFDIMYRTPTIIAITANGTTHAKNK